MPPNQNRVRLSTCSKSIPEVRLTDCFPHFLDHPAFRKETKVSPLSYILRNIEMAGPGNIYGKGISPTDFRKSIFSLSRIKNMFLASLLQAILPNIMSLTCRIFSNTKQSKAINRPATDYQQILKMIFNQLLAMICVKTT